jgi:hypothetical protein
MSNRQAAWAIAATVVLSAFMSGSTAAQKEPGDSILWSDAAHTNAAFLSGSALEAVASHSVDEVTRITSLSAANAAEAKTELDIDLGVTREAREHGRGCMRHAEGIGLGTAPIAGSLSFADLIQREAIAVVGIVERATAGLTLHTTDISTYTVLRVSEVLRDTSKSIQPGQTVSFLQLGGSIAYQGSMLCTDPGGRHVPAVGEHLLLIGVQDFGETVPGKLLPTWLFVVENGDVVPNAFYRPLAETRAKPLTQIRAELAGRAPRHD